MTVILSTFKTFDAKLKHHTCNIHFIVKLKYYIYDNDLLSFLIETEMPNAKLISHL